MHEYTVWRQFRSRGCACQEAVSTHYSEKDAAQDIQRRQKADAKAKDTDTINYWWTCSADSRT